MQLVETHILNTKEVEAICIKAKLLYNQSLYYLRQSFFGNIEKFSEYELTGLFAKYNEETFRLLPSNTSQQIVKILFRNWKSYWIALRDWKKNPLKYRGKPELPKYKKKTSVVVFAGQKVRLKNGYIRFPKKANLPLLKTSVDNICQVRIIPQATTFKIEVVYEKQITDLNLSKENILALDLGLNNFATSTNNVGLPPFIVNGKPLKSFNHWYNKRQAKLRSYVGNRGISNGLKSLHHYRNNYVEDKMHKISRWIVNYCIANNIGSVVVGKNDRWKNGINLGSNINQKFVEIPHARFIDKLSYKYQLVGIDFSVNEESYTSKCDAFALEPIQKHETYTGKRKKRGLFQSSTGQLVNADVNGSVNIGRKVFGDSFAKAVLDSGQAFCPYKINIL